MKNPTTCQSRRESIVALTLGELDPADAAELRQHLENCDSCRGVRDALAEEEAVVRSDFDALARRIELARDTLAERFGKDNPVQDSTVRPRALWLGARIVKGWQTMNTRYKAASALMAAGIVVAVATVLLWPTQQAAYALGQTIEAVKKVHFVHTIMRNDQGQVMDERWIEMGADGNQARYRQDANSPQRGVSLLIIDDGKACYALDRQKNVVMLKHSGAYQWIYNLGEFFRQMTGKGTVTIEQNVQYNGRRAHKVRWLDTQMDCFIDPQTRLPIAVGGMEISYGDPPADAFTIPTPPKGMEVVDMRSDSAAAKQERGQELKKAKLFSEGRKALAAKDYARAAESLSGAIQMSPMENWIWYWRGDAYAGLGQWDKAIADYTKVIEMFKMTPYYAHLARGLAWQQNGESAKANADLAVALPVMIDCLRHPDGAKEFDYADMPTDVNAAITKLTPAQRQENMIRRLQKAAGQDFGYKAGMDAQQLEQAIQAAKQWWQKHASDYSSSDVGSSAPAE